MKNSNTTYASSAKRTSDTFAHRRFTIVELLIVIVVIGILAAISVVAYNGIQNRAHDTTIKNDLINFAKQLHLSAVDFGTLPTGGGGKLPLPHPTAVTAQTFPALNSAPPKPVIVQANPT